MLNYIEKRLSGKGSVVYEANLMREGYLGERVMTRSTRILRIVIYAYITVAVLRVIVKRNGRLLLKWLRILLTYFHLK